VCVCVGGGGLLVLRTKVLLKIYFATTVSREDIGTTLANIDGLNDSRKSR
jgi:hypothetical protein